ncbi:MAG: cyclase family protein [Pseudomonadota bacterium]
MGALATLAQAMAGGSVRTVDLTFTLDPDFPVLVLPQELGQCEPFRVEEVSRYDARGPGWYWQNFTCNEHTGTHFDAPIHWISGRDLPNNSVDTIPVERFVAPAVVADFSAECAADEDFVLTAAHVKAWEDSHGKIAAGSWFLFRTDWSKREPAAYINLREDGAHSPGPDAGALDYLIHEAGIVGFGVETIGTDAGQGEHFDPPHPAHLLLHGNNRYGLQCLRNLDQLPPVGAMLICAPLKIKQGSGSPLRVLALVEETP